MGLSLRALSLSGIALAGLGYLFEMGSFCAFSSLHIIFSRVSAELPIHNRRIPTTRRTGNLPGVGGVFVVGYGQSTGSGPPVNM